MPTVVSGDLPKMIIVRKFDTSRMIKMTRSSFDTQSMDDAQIELRCPTMKLLFHDKIKKGLT